MGIGQCVRVSFIDVTFVFDAFDAAIVVVYLLYQFEFLAKGPSRQNIGLSIENWKCLQVINRISMKMKTNGKFGQGATDQFNIQLCIVNMHSEKYATTKSV